MNGRHDNTAALPHTRDHAAVDGSFQIQDIALVALSCSETRNSLYDVSAVRYTCNILFA